MLEGNTGKKQLYAGNWAEHHTGIPLIKPLNNAVRWVLF